MYIPVPPSGGGGGGGGGAPPRPPREDCIIMTSLRSLDDSPAGGGGGGVAGTPPLVELSLLKLSRLGFWATMGEGRALLQLGPPITGAGAGGVALSRGEEGPAH